MKTPNLLRSLALCATLAFCAPLHAEDNPPPRIDALQVAKTASAYLATHGKSAPYIVSIIFESDALIWGSSSWVVRWSHPILADGNKEVGMRVKPDGSVTYMVEEKAAKKKRTLR